MSASTGWMWYKKKILFQALKWMTTPGGLTAPYMFVLGSFNTGVWNHYLLGSTDCVSRHPEEGKCADTSFNVLAHIKDLFYF